MRPISLDWQSQLTQKMPCGIGTLGGTNAFAGVVCLGKDFVIHFLTSETHKKVDFLNK